MAMISAHRAADGGLPALAAAAASGVDHVELDVRRTRDGVFVVSHDPTVLRDGVPVAVRDLEFGELADVTAATGYPIPTLLECLRELQARVGAHVDLKISSPPALRAKVGDDAERTWEVQIARSVLAFTGEDAAVFTTGNERSIAVLRAWAHSAGFPRLLVGLSLGRGVQGLGPAQAARLLRSELFPGSRVEASGANLVVAQKELALINVSRWARRHHVPVLVWTVDTDRELAYWLKPGRAWMITTNRPSRALEIAAHRTP